MGADVEDRADDEKPWDCGPDCGCRAYYGDDTCDDDGDDDGDDDDGMGFPVFTGVDRDSVARLFAKISAALLSARINERSDALRSLYGAQGDVAVLRGYVLSHSFAVSVASATVNLERAASAIETALVHLHSAFLIAERSPDDEKHRLHHEAESLSLANKAACHLLQAAANFLEC